MLTGRGMWPYTVPMNETNTPATPAQFLNAALSLSPTSPAAVKALKALARTDAASHLKYLAANVNPGTYATAPVALFNALQMGLIIRGLGYTEAATEAAKAAAKLADASDWHCDAKTWLLSNLGI